MVLGGLDGASSFVIECNNIEFITGQQLQSIVMLMKPLGVTLIDGCKVSHGNARG